MKTVYPDENNVVLNENSVERKPCINREIKSNELTIQLYSCHNINMKLLVVVTPTSIYQNYTFLDPVYQCYTKKKFHITKEKLDLWISPTHNYGDALNYWILVDNQTVLA